MDSEVESAPITPSAIEMAPFQGNSVPIDVPTTASATAPAPAAVAEPNSAPTVESENNKSRK
jgi:hypothetical protein